MGAEVEIAATAKRGRVRSLCLDEDDAKHVLVTYYDVVATKHTEWFREDELTADE